MYKRILLKLSGEALGLDGKLFDHAMVDRVAKVIKQVKDTGVQLGIVIGGGNIWRGRQGPSANMNPVIADQMGMTATLLNCLLMQDALLRQGLKAVVQSAVFMDRFCESYSTHKAVQYLEDGTVLLFALGSGNPFFSTDTAVALRAVEVGADAIFMAKNIDGVYDDDPRTNKNAKLIPDITYQKCIEMDLKVMDQTAFSLCKDNNLPEIRVFGLSEPENILKALKGELPGTFIHP
jgi:uridylate kinase